MKAYRYDKITGEYIGTRERQIDPLETKERKKNVYLTPANCILKKPMTVLQDEVACVDGKNWIVKKDFRKKIYYNTETKETETIKNIDEDPHNKLTDKVPSDFNYDEWNGNDWIFNQAKFDEDEAEGLKNRIINLQTRIDSGEKNDFDMSKEIGELNDLKN